MSTTESVIPEFPFAAASAGDAVARFFNQCCTYNRLAAHRFGDDITKTVRMIVDAAVANPAVGMLEIKFHEVTSAGAFNLTYPKELFGFLEELFGADVVALKPEMTHDTTRSGGQYILHVYPHVVLFAGVVIWRYPKLS